MKPLLGEIVVKPGESLGKVIRLVGKMSEPGLPVLVQVDPYDDYSDRKTYLFRSTKPGKVQNEILGGTEIIHLTDKRILRLYTKKESGFFSSQEEAYVFEKGVYVLNDAVQTFEKGVSVNCLEVVEIGRPMSSEAMVLAGASIYDFFLDPVLRELDY